MIDLQTSQQTGHRVRTLGPADLQAVRALLAADPAANAFVDSRIRLSGLDVIRLGAEIWGYECDGQLISACYVGANIVPVEATPEAARAFGEHARTRPGMRRCSSIWGPRQAVEPLWQALAPAWGPARDVRLEQPFMALARDPDVAPDPMVRRVSPMDFELVYSSSVAFFIEELGVSPEAGGAGYAYRSRVLDLVNRHRAFARIEDGRVVFKAEVGIETPLAFQIQGVWVPPDRRGQGLAAPGMAAVVAAGLREVAPVATLYVNAHNTSARRAYASVGFEECGTFMTVLF